jgi:pyruvate kinase
MKMKIFCTLGPSTFNKKFLKFINGKVDLVRINMSHMSLKKLKEIIKFIKKYSKVPICLDTEGAQIRTKVKREQRYNVNQNLNIYKNEAKNFSLYPENIFEQIKVKDILELGFTGLIVKVIKSSSNQLNCKVLTKGKLETNKGVHLKNRKLKMNYLTQKDFQAIKIAKKNKIKFYALSFTNSIADVKKFNNILANKTKIFKLETKSSIKNLNEIMKQGKNFLIDRGDLSKDISIEQIPIAQRKILALGKKRKKNIYVATNFLESMIKSDIPNRGEVNDIYNTLELGAAGLVLAAETAIGRYPESCINILKKIINVFNKNKKKFK